MEHRKTIKEIIQTGVAEPVQVQERRIWTDRQKNPGTALVISLLLLCMTGAGLIAWFLLFPQSLRLDESQSLWQTARSPQAMVVLVAQDVHVPLYHTILHFWELLAGEGVERARALSLIFFLLTIPAIYHVGRLTYSKWTGLFAAFLLTISPFMNWYGSEIRMYSLLAFLSVVNLYFFVSIYKRPSRNNWIWYAATAVLGAYTHYFFLFALITQAVYFFSYRNLFPQNSFRNFALVAGIVAVALAPWVLFAWSEHMTSGASTSPALPPPTSVNVFSAFSQFLFGFQNDRWNTVIVSFWPLAILFAFMVLRRNRTVTPITMYFILATVLPILFAFGISLFRPLFLARYLIVSLPPLYLFLAWLLSAYPEKLAVGLKSSLAAVMMAGFFVQTVSADISVKENYREAAAYLSNKTGPQDSVIVSAPFTVYPMEYYYRGPAAVNTLPIWDRYVPGPIPPFSETDFPNQVQKLTEGRTRAWLLLSYDQGYSEKLRIYFDTHFERVASMDFSPGLVLYEYKLRYDTVSSRQK